MADLEDTLEEPAEQLWEQLDDIHAGMLGVEGSGQHMQPMAPQLDRDANIIWFYSRRDSDLARAAGGGSRAHFCVIGKDHDYHACLSGTLRQVDEGAPVDRFWSPVVAAWFEGKHDPALTMLELDLEEAAIWASPSSALAFGWEILKANLTDEEPDVGVKTNISF